MSEKPAFINKKVLQAKIHTVSKSTYNAFPLDNITLLSNFIIADVLFARPISLEEVMEKIEEYIDLKNLEVLEND